MLSELVYASTSSEGHMMCMDQNLTAFADCLGTCERLVKTPIPLSYTRYDLGKRRRPAWPVWPCNCCLAACGPLANRRPASALHKHQTLGCAACSGTSLAGWGCAPGQT